MGQKVNPKGFRVGVYRDWDARWFARGASYGDLLLEDIKIRRLIGENVDSTDISQIELEKAVDNIRIIIHSAKPGIIIGKRGQGIDFLRGVLEKELKGKAIDISVREIKVPELDALVMANNIARQLERRASFKRVMKRAAGAAMRAGAPGVKICCAGRLNGAEIAREEWVRMGSVPLHTLRCNVDYGLAEAKTTYGMIGVKVWVSKGEFQLG